MWNRRSLTSRVQLLHIGFALPEAPLLAALTARLDGFRGES